MGVVYPSMIHATTPGVQVVKFGDDVVNNTLHTLWVSGS